MGPVVLLTTPWQWPQLSPQCSFIHDGFVSHSPALVHSLQLLLFWRLRQSEIRQNRKALRETCYRKECPIEYRRRCHIEI